jgi:hypothetical protein
VSVSLSPASPSVSDTLTCSASGSDDDGDDTTITFTWTVGGSTVAGTTVSTTISTLAGVFAVGQTVACRADISDDKGGSDYDTAEVEITNTAPEITSVTLSPSSAYTNDTITASVSTSDDDGDTVTVSYAWYVDGSLVSATGSTLDGATYFDKDEEVYVTVTPSDDEDTGEAATSGTTTVLNTPPTAPEVSVAEVERGCTEFSLSFSGSEHMEATLPSELTTGGTKYVEAWVWPSTTDSEPTGIVSWGTDTCPGRSFRLVFNPDTNTLAMDGSCFFWVSDVAIPRGEWSKVYGYYDSDTGLYGLGRIDTDGVEESTRSSGSGNTPDASPLYIGRYFSYRDYRGLIGSLQIFTAIPSDSTKVANRCSGTEPDDDDSLVASYQMTEGSGSTTVDDVTSASVAVDGLTWSTETPEGSSTLLICRIDELSSDDDGDAISYIFDWDVDGAAYTDTDTTTEEGDTVPPEALGYDETWTCTVTPNDGDEDGAYGVDSITVAACADGTSEAGYEKFGHYNMVYCEHYEAGLPSVAEAEDACGTGWHVCTESEWYERNDECDDTLTPFAARLDFDGDCGVSHWTGDDRYMCSADLTSAGSGDCTAETSGSRWSTQGLEDHISTAACTDEALAGGCGTLCCTGAFTPDDSYGPPVWTDSTSSLMWENPPSEDDMNWDEATTYCEDLIISAYTDWRLPTIAEMRTLMRGCPTVETGGACNVTEGDCLEGSCVDTSACHPSMTGCSEGDGPSPDGCYWPDEMLGSCETYWTASVVADQSIPTAWEIFYADAGVSGSRKTYSQPVRCVRDP